MNILLSYPCIFRDWSRIDSKLIWTTRNIITGEYTESLVGFDTREQAQTDFWDAWGNHTITWG